MRVRVRVRVRVRADLLRARGQPSRVAVLARAVGRAGVVAWQSLERRVRHVEACEVRVRANVRVRVRVRVRVAVTVRVG